MDTFFTTIFHIHFYDLHLHTLPLLFSAPFLSDINITKTDNFYLPSPTLAEDSDHVKMSSNAVIVHPQRRNIFDRLPNEMIVKIAESMGPEDRATFSMFSSRTNRVVGDRRYDDNVREGELSLVRVAAQAGNIEILERLERLARDDVVNWNVLPPTNPDIQDVDMDDVEWIDFLDDDADGWTALHIAAAFGNENIINFLWERGVPIDTPDTTMPIGLTPLF